MQLWHGKNKPAIEKKERKKLEHFILHLTSKLRPTPKPPPLLEPILQTTPLTICTENSDSNSYDNSHTHPPTISQKTPFPPKEERPNTLGPGKQESKKASPNKKAEKRIKGQQNKGEKNPSQHTIMLRRKPTAIEITSEDIAAFEESLLPIL